MMKLFWLSKTLGRGIIFTSGDVLVSGFIMSVIDVLVGGVVSGDGVILGDGDV